MAMAAKVKQKKQQQQQPQQQQQKKTQPVKQQQPQHQQQLLQQIHTPNGIAVQRGAAQLTSFLPRLIAGLSELRQRMVISLPKLSALAALPGELWSNVDVTGRLLVVDGALSCGVWTPLVVLFWWGAWGVLDDTVLYLLGTVWGSALLLSFSISIQVTAGYCQRAFSNRIRPFTSLGCAAASRLYSLILGWAAVCHYRGLAVLWQAFKIPGSVPSIRLAVTTSVLLCGLGRAGDVLGPPFSIGLDPDTSDFTHAPSLLYLQPDCSVASLLDHVATVSFLNSLVHLHWLALWDVIAELLSPCNPIVSILTSWTLGYFTVICFMAYENKIRDYCASLSKPVSGMLTDLLGDICKLFANVGCIFVWHGFWNLYDLLGEYFPIYQNTSDVTAAYTNWAAFCLLVVAHISSSLVHKTCDPVQEASMDNITSTSWFDFNYFGKLLTENSSEENEEARDQNGHPGSDSTSSSSSSSTTSLDAPCRCRGVYWDISRRRREDYSSSESMDEDYLEEHYLRAKDRWATIY